MQDRYWAIHRQAFICLQRMTKSISSVIFSLLTRELNQYHICISIQTKNQPQLYILPNNILSPIFFYSTVIHHQTEFSSFLYHSITKKIIGRQFGAIENSTEYARTPFRAVLLENSNENREVSTAVAWSWQFRAINSCINDIVDMPRHLMQMSPRELL